MYKDPTAFRERFKLYKEGKKPYDAGLPRYKDGEKPAHETFVEKIGPILYKELLRTNTDNIDLAYDNMMRQLAYESDYGRSRVAAEQHNYGGYGWNGKTYTTFKDDDDFIRHYVGLMNNRYKNAVLAKTVLEYGKALKDKGYYEDTLLNYTKNLSGMKSLSRSASAHRNNNPNLYKLTQPTVSPLISLLEAQPKFEPVPVKLLLEPQKTNVNSSSNNSSFMMPMPNPIELYNQFWEDNPLSKPVW